MPTSTEIIDMVQGRFFDRLTDEDYDHLRVLLEAFDIYLDRNAKHGSLWKKFGWMDSIVSVRGKAARTVQQWWGDLGSTRRGGMSADLDDPIDLINFCVFLINNVRAENKWGTDA